MSRADTTSIFQLKNQAPIYLMGLGHGATHWIAATFTILLPLMTEDLGLSYTEAGLLYSIFYVSSFAANFGSGFKPRPLSDAVRPLWHDRGSGSRCILNDAIA